MRKELDVWLCLVCGKAVWFDKGTSVMRGAECECNPFGKVRQRRAVGLKCLIVVDERPE